MRRKKRDDQQSLFKLAVLIVLIVLLGTGALFKMTTFIAKPLVKGVFNATQQEAERQANQPRLVITTSGERIDCKRVLDQGKYWGLIRKDGKISALKKELVQEIQVLDAAAK